MRIVIDNLCVRRGERQVLLDVSAAVASGEALAVVGPNGSGKSTLLRALAGLLPIEAGEIRLEDAPAGEVAHYLGHQNALKPALTVRDNVMFWHRVNRAPGNGAAGDGPEGNGVAGDQPEENRAAGDGPEGNGAAGSGAEGNGAAGDGREGDGEEAAFAALEAVALAHLSELPAFTLSQGQRRRLALARLLVTHRPVWLLDEPTAGLDAASQDAFAGLIARHLSSGGLVIAATHEPLRADPLATLTLH